MKTKMDQPEEVHVVDRKKPKVDQRNAKGDPQSVKPHKQINCKFCARKHEEEKENVQRGEKRATNVAQKITLL